MSVEEMMDGIGMSVFIVDETGVHPYKYEDDNTTAEELASSFEQAIKEEKENE